MNPYHRHAQVFRPEPQRPICYRTHRTLLQRLRPVLLAALGFGLVALLALGAAALVARLHATEAQLDAARLQGMASGQSMCASH